jgi:2-keto-4-pentenoate hydratase
MDRRPESENAAYQLQSQIHEVLAAAGIDRVGFKIGSTSDEGQKALGLSEPVYAGIYAVTRASSLREALSVPLVRPLIECEIAFITGAELAPEGDLSDEGLARAITSAHLACEIVDNRYGSPLEVGIPTILTDDFFHSAFVLGPAHNNWRGLLDSDLYGTIEIDGFSVQGSTAQVLCPFDSLRWLVRKLGAQGLTIGAGEIVLTGSIVKPTPISLSAKTASIGVEGFGSLSTAG